MSAAITVVCWGAVIGFCAFGKAKDVLRSFERTPPRVRMVPPRPAQVPDWDWPELDHFDAMASQIEEIRGLAETEPDRRLAF